MSRENPRFCNPAAPVPGWQWQATPQGQPYLTCELLAPWPHGFFTQPFAPQIPRDLAPILGGNPQTAYRLKQVHGPIVLTPTEIRDWGEGFPDGDGLVTEEPGASVWVASADCTPVLVGDRLRGQVAAIHSGWRGTAQGAVGAAVARLLAHGSALEDLVFALGPAIAGEVYQVTTQVGAQVAASLQACAGLTGEEAIAHLQAQPDPPLLPDPQPGRVRLDVRQIIRRQLIELGVEDGDVAIAPCCTYQQPDYFFSYRRTHAKNVQWSGILSIAPLAGSNQTNPAVATLPSDPIIGTDPLGSAMSKSNHKPKDQTPTEGIRTEERAWGTVTILEEGSRYRINRIEVKPQHHISTQMHYHRSEHWIVVAGTAKVICNGEETLLMPKQSTYVPMNTTHRVENPGVIPLVMIEVQNGEFLGDEDIIRLPDHQPSPQSD